MAPSNSATENATPAFILVVDDDAATLDAIGDVLRDEGYEVAVAANGREAAEKCERRLPDLLLTDFEMPAVDGEKLIETLRDNGHTRLPILVITARLVVDAEREAVRLGVNGYLNKPIDIDRLVSEVGRALSGR